MTTTTPTTVNGVDTTALLTTREAVRQNQELAQFQFRATNSWISGTHNRSTIDGYFGACQELDRAGGFTLDADHPPVLTGGDHGPTPVEFLLHALAACLTAGLVNIASARGITLTKVSSTVTGDIDLLGILGLDPDVRNGYTGIHVVFDVEGDASAEELAGLVERSRRRSAVLDMLTNGTNVDIAVRTA